MIDEWVLTSPSKHGMKDYDEYNPSTITFMVYCNIDHDLPNIFKEMDVVTIDVPSTKNGKNMDLSGLSVPFGTIISVQTKTMIRGSQIKKRKKLVCTVCNGDPKNVTPLINEEMIDKRLMEENVKTSTIDYMKNVDDNQQKNVNNDTNTNNDTNIPNVQNTPNIQNISNNQNIPNTQNISDKNEGGMAFFKLKKDETSKNAMFSNPISDYQSDDRNFIYKHKSTTKKKNKTITSILLKGEGDVSYIKYYCNTCKKYYDPSDIKKVNNFLNQVTIILSLGDRPLINVMMFIDNLKIISCRKDEDIQQILEILYIKNILKKNPKLIKIKECSFGIKIKEKDVNHKDYVDPIIFEHPSFIVDTVMRNVTFNMGFNINRQKLHEVMNDKRFNDIVRFSYYESSGNSNVCIKMFNKTPDEHRHKVYTIMKIENKSKGKGKGKGKGKSKGKGKGKSCTLIDFGYTLKDSIVTVIPIIPFKTKKPNKDVKDVSFVVYRSSETIISGKYKSVTKTLYNFFVNFCFHNKKSIEEIIMIPNKEDICSVIKNKPRLCETYYKLQN